MTRSRRLIAGLRAQGRTASIAKILVAFVTLLAGLVYALGAALPLRAEDKSQVERAFLGELPGNVAEMREAILAAAKSGHIEELRTAIEWNELRPDFGAEASADPIDLWRRLSADGEGREMLALLVTMLEMPPHRLAIGPDAENAGVFVWPYVAELPLDDLKPGEVVDILRLMPVATFNSLKLKKKWAWWRLAISADGTWLTFRKYE